MLRSLCAFCAFVTLVSCDRGQPDVLQEFPPPRLARDSPIAASSSASVPADCNVAWRLFGRKSREVYQLSGHGTFEVHGQPTRLVSGIVAIDPSTSRPELRASVERALRTRGAGKTWLWRVLNVEQRALASDPTAVAGSSGANVLTGASEMELNGVRTRQAHDISFKLTPRAEEFGELRFETQLRVDLGAHHVSGIVLADDSPPRRADLVVQCRLATSAEGD